MRKIFLHIVYNATFRSLNSKDREYLKTSAARQIAAEEWLKRRRRREQNGVEAGAKEAAKRPAAVKNFVHFPRIFK